MDIYRQLFSGIVQLMEVLTHDTSHNPQASQAPDDGLEREALREMIATSMKELNPRYAEALRLRLQGNQRGILRRSHGYDCRYF